MFGYIRPMQGELKVYELERFKACYCGLCHCLRTKYGLSAGFILNYELVFLAMLLWAPDENPVFEQGRCIAGPFRKKRYCAANDVLSTCAGYNVILTWWKLKDSVADNSFFKAIPHRLALMALRGAYKKASHEFSGFNESVRALLDNLSDYEASGETSLDGAADNFAKILCAAIPQSAPETVIPPLNELMYHLGRWVYIIDACDDYSDDFRDGRYNPVAARYPGDIDGEISKEGLERLKATLSHSNSLLRLAYELLPDNAWSGIVSNIILFGMPYICESVLSGEWPIKDKKWN